MNDKTSRVHGFYKKTHDQRLDFITNFSSLSHEEVTLLKRFASLPPEIALDFASANRMVENVISVMPVPLGVAPNFLINSKNYLVPMAIEESSVIAAASNAAKLARAGGGFTATATPPIMIGQIHLTSIPDADYAIAAIEQHKQELLAAASGCDPVLIGVGGGACDIVCRRLAPRMLMIHLLVDVQDAMGANIVNTMAEHITERLEKITGGTAGVRIVSNLSVHRMVQAQAVWKKELLSDALIKNIIEIYKLAIIDPYRCATHNKGIMNGIDAVALATGNDFRAIEAGVHAYAALGKNGYRPLTQYTTSKNGDLLGTLELPLAVGIVGGIIQAHPMSQVCLKILNVQSASELACVMGAVGLGQNFAALRALASEGISRGHMRLHSKNITVNAGVPRELVDVIAQQMINEENISVSRARELLIKTEQRRSA